MEETVERAMAWSQRQERPKEKKVEDELQKKLKRVKRRIEYRLIEASSSAGLTDMVQSRLDAGWHLYKGPSVAQSVPDYQSGGGWCPGRLTYVQAVRRITKRGDDG